LYIAQRNIILQLFKFFCNANNIFPDTKSCSTSYWPTRKRDFILDGKEWNLKYSFLQAFSSDLGQKYTDLPALVPNRHNDDEWSKRNLACHSGSDGVAFLFAFLKRSVLTSEKQKKFIDINLNQAQQDYIHHLYEKYNKMHLPQESYQEDDFWKEMNSLGPNEYLVINDYPDLIITGYADKTIWDIFRDTGRSVREYNWVNYCSPSWYSKDARRGYLSFLNGALYSIITNATVPVSKLPSFLSLFPHLNNQLKYAYFG
jgi:hypothetical protein